MSCVFFVTLLVTVIRSSHGDSDVPDIRLPPEIISQGKKHIYFRKDTEEILPCEAQGTPSPLRYEWLRNGEYLDLDSSMSLNGGNLVITGLQSRHEGYYQCKAKNKYGMALSNVTFLQAAVRGAFPSSADPENLRRALGHPLEILCRWSSSSVPKALFSWQIADGVNDKHPVNLVLDGRKGIDENGTLYFAHLTKDDHREGKVYKCVVRNAVLDSSQGGSYTTVEVSDSSEPPPPMSILSATRSVVGLVGENVTLKCIFSGSPTPRVIWRDSRGIALPRGTSQTVDAYGTELRITRLRKEDEGIYRCLGSQQGNISDPVQLNLQVQAAPQFIGGSRPVSVNKTEGQDHTFRCNASGEPQPHIQWFVNGEADFDDPKIELSGGSLTIRNLCKDCENGRTDLKTVQCNASNVHGYVFASAYLNVLKRTQVTVAPESFTYTTNETMPTISCTSKTDDSTTLTVKWKHRGVTLRSGDDPRLNITEDHTIIIDVEGMELQEISNRFSGEYTCVAYNEYTSGTGVSQIIVPGVLPTEKPLTGGATHLWWILLMIMLLLLLLLLTLCCCLSLQRNKGDMYPVDEKERENGRDPEKECMEDGFHDYQRPEDLNPSQSSRSALIGALPDLDRSAELHRSLKQSMDRSMDMDDASLGSLAEYGDFEERKFNEDGSFIGRYNTTGSQNYE